MSSHYLQLEKLPISFDPIDKVQSAFFDQTNFQMFCVQHGFTDVRVKGLSEEDSFKITIPARGPVSTIKFSPGTPRVLSVQRRKTSVEFVNIFAEKSTEQSLPSRANNCEIIGFYWVFKNEYVVIVTTNWVELYQCNPYRMTFKSLRSYTMPVSWAIFSPEEHMLLVCIKGSSVLYPFAFRQGLSVPIVKIPKFEVEMVHESRFVSPSSCLMERDVVIVNLYGIQYVAVIRSSATGQGAEVLLYQLFTDVPAKLTHVLCVDINGRFTLSVVDNLVVLHHQAWKTSMLFDVAFGGESVGPLKKHQPVLAPLSIAPTSLQLRAKERRSSLKAELLPSRMDPVAPELYSNKWIFFQPNVIIDAHHGVMWRLGLNLDAIGNMMTDKRQLLQLLLRRKGGKGIIMAVCCECLEPGRQINLAVLGAMFDLINQAYKALWSDVPTSTHYQVKITQKDLYTRLFVCYSDRSDMPYKFLVAVLVEYIRSLHKAQIAVEHFIFEMVMNLLIEKKCFYQLHQFLQYHVISDSKELACLLLSKELVYPPATQLAMDMFKRLSTAESEIIDILLSRGQILTALKYIKAAEKIDSVSARQFLEAAANEDDKMLFFTVYRFFEDRNIRLRKRVEFPAEEQCEQYEQLFKKWYP